MVLKLCVCVCVCVCVFILYPMLYENESLLQGLLAVLFVVLNGLPVKLSDIIHHLHHTHTHTHTHTKNSYQLYSAYICKFTVRYIYIKTLILIRQRPAIRIIPALYLLQKRESITTKYHEQTPLHEYKNMLHEHGALFCPWMLICLFHITTEVLSNMSLKEEQYV